MALKDCHLGSCQADPWPGGVADASLADAAREVTVERYLGRKPNPVVTQRGTHMAMVREI